MQYMSDLHLEFGPMEPPEVKSDILVLAGDILIADHLRKSDASPYNRHAMGYDKFMDWARESFEEVIMIMGNHEHYKGDITKSASLIRAAYPEIHLLDNDFLDLDGLTVYGGTMWTNMDRGNPLTIHSAKYGMNDFRIIKNSTRPFSPENAVRRFNDFWLRYRPCDVVISHHAPSFRSIDPTYVSDSLNGAYASTMDERIMDEGPSVWIHGHIHCNQDYRIGGTRVLCNPRGYYGHHLNMGFNPCALAF